MPLPFDVRQNIIYLGVESAKEVIRQIARGERTLGLICGGTGLGKTYLVRQICRHHLIRNVPEERPTDSHALVKLVWQYRECPVVLLDECDNLLRQETALNMLKVMNGNPRRCSYYSVESIRNEEYLERGSSRYSTRIPPTTFDLNNLCRQLLISNRNYQDPEVSKSLVAEHWNALIGRGLDVVWIETAGNDGRDMFDYVVSLSSEGKMLRSLGFDYATARDAVNFYIQHVDRLVDIQPRRVVLIAQAMKNAGNNKVSLDARLSQMLRAPMRPKFREPETSVLLWPRRPPRPKRRHRHAPHPTPPGASPAAPKEVDFHKLEKLRTLANHPNTPPHERAAALAAVKRLLPPRPPEPDKPDGGFPNRGKVFSPDAANS